MIWYSSLLALTVRDKDYSRNSSCALISIFMFLLQRSIKHEAIRDKMKTKIYDTVRTIAQSNIEIIERGAIDTLNNIYENDRNPTYSIKYLLMYHYR